MNKEWNITNKNPDLDNIIDEILENRGIQNISHFLNPNPSDLIPMNQLMNMDKSVEIITKGLKDGKWFTVFYDSADTDGVCAGTMMRKYLSQFTDKVSYIFASGKKHGLQHIDLDLIIETTDILIVVDSSTGDHKQQNYLVEHNVEVVIYDHHAEPNNPNVCIVNSQFSEYPNPQLSGSGVTWKGCLALDKALGTNYALNYIDLAAIGILADVSSVCEEFMENRLIVNLGLHHLKNTAVKMIIGTYEFNSTSVLFSIAPLINGAARMSKNQIVIDFMMEEDKKKAKILFEQLKEIKENQNILVKIASNNLDKQIETQDYINNKVVYGFVDGGEFAGLIATKMCEKYGRPAIVLHTPKEGDIQYRGSIRAVGISNFKSIINETGFGKAMGHESAAGIFIPVENFELLLAKLNEILKDVEFKTEETIDIQLNPGDITPKLIEQMEKINRLTGKDFKPITVFIKGIEVKSVSNMQLKHTKFESEGLEFIKWNSTLYEDLKCSDGIYKTLDVFGSLSISNFRGKKSKQMIISDVRNIEENLSFFR